MQKQKYYCSHLQTLAKLILSAFKGISLQKRRGKTLEKISLWTLFLLIYLIGSSHFPTTKYLLLIQKKIKTIKKILSTSEDRDEAKTPQRQVSTSLLRKKKKTPFKSNTFTVGRKVFMLTIFFRKKNQSQNTSIGLGNFYTCDCSQRESY